MEHFNNFIILGLRVALSSIFFITVSLFYERIILYVYLFKNGCNCLTYIASSLFLHHFYIKSHVPLWQPSNCSNGICYYRKERVNTLCRMPLHVVQTQRHNAPSLFIIHVARHCNAVTRRDAWSFVRKVASVSGEIDLSSRTVLFLRATSTYARIRMVLVWSSSWRGRTLHVTRYTRVNGRARMRLDHRRQKPRRSFHFHSRRVSPDIKVLNSVDLIRFNLTKL